MGAAGTVLITGATSGIGYELAKCFARDQYHLVLVARRHEELTRVAEELTSAHRVSVRVIAKDLAQPSAADEVAAELARENRPVDVLVNNAGVGTYGRFASADLASETAMIQVNVVALTQLTRLLLPGMLQRGHGRILNVASTAAFQPGPLMSVYYATKAYVLSFSEALANELRGSGVSVTALCPGPTRTNFQQRAGIEHSRVFSGRIMDASTVARMGYRALMLGKPVVVPGLKNVALMLAVRWFPRRLVTSVVRRLNEHRTPQEGGRSWPMGSGSSC